MSLSGLFSGGIGAASVELVADTKPLIATLDKAKAETQAATGSMTRSTQGFSTFATGAFLAAGAAVVKFMGDAVAAANAHQVAITNLSIAARGLTKDFVDLASQQEALTGFTEDSIIAAETYLARLGLTSDEMRKLLPLVEDYARATGRALPEAAALVEKASLGNAKAIKELGHQYKATGNTAKDLTTLENILTQAVGGSAAAFAKTAAGQVEKMNADYEKLKIQVGQGLQPAFIALLHIIQDLMPVFRVLGFVILATVGVYSQFVAVIQDSIAAIQNFGHFMEDLVGIHHAADAATNHTALAYEQTKKSLEDYAHQTDAAAQSTGGLTGQQQKAADSAAFLAKSQKAAAAAATAQKNAEDALRGGLLGLVGAQRQVIADQQNLNDLRKQGKQGTVAYGDAELQLLQDQLGLTTATKDYLANLHKSGDTQKQVVAQITAMGRAVGLTRDQINQLLAAYLNAWGQINAHPLGAHVTPGGFLQGKLTGPVGSTGGGASTTHVTVHVHGSVTTQNDLVNAIHTSLLRKKTRNAGVLGL